MAFLNAAKSPEGLLVSKYIAMLISLLNEASSRNQFLT
jgi:hypothetical protein